MAHHLHADDLAALVESESDGGARERDVPHLVDCPGCRDRFRQLQRVRTRLVASAASAPAPRGFEERVMERVFASPKPAAQPTGRGILVPRFSWPAPVGGGRRALMGVAAAAAVVLIAVFVAGLGQKFDPSRQSPYGVLVTAKSPSGDVRLIWGTPYKKQ